MPIHLSKIQLKNISNELSSFMHVQGIKQKYLNLLGLAILTGTLSACNSMPKQSAGASVKNGIASLENSDSFTFQIKQKSRLQPLTNDSNTASSAKSFSQKLGLMAKGKSNAALTDTTKTEADCDAELEEKLASMSYEEAEEAYLVCLEAAMMAEKTKENSANPLADFDKKTDKLKKLMTPERIQAIDTYWLQPTVVHIDGVLDKPSKKLQVTYKINYQPKNFQLSMAFPMLMDFSDMSLTLDPAIALPILAPIFTEEVGTKWQGKAIKFTLPEKFAKEIPTDIILSALGTSITNSYAQLPDTNFKYLDNQDVLAQQIQARQVVNMTMDAKQRLNLFDNFLKNWIQAIDVEVQRNPSAAKDMKAFNGMLEMAKAFTEKGVSSALLSEEKEEDNFLLDMLGEHDTKFYLDRSGHINAMQSIQRLDALKDILNAQIINNNTVTITDVNSARLTFNPSSADIIDGNALFEKFQKLDKKGSDTDSKDDAAGATAE